MAGDLIPENFPHKPITSKRVWGKGSNFDDMIHTFSNETHQEVKSYIKKRVSIGPLKREDIEGVEYNPRELQSLTNEIDLVRPQVDTGIGFVVFPQWDDLNIHESRVASWLVDNVFGDTGVQNSEGSRLIEIFNVSDNLSMKTGARYHETREGNSPHTDAPQVPNDPDYLCLRCVSDSWIGGENILVTGDSIYNNLLKNAPELINVLSSNFLFHCRGVDGVEGKGYFPAPVIDIEDGGIRLRFLDHYIREGHRLADRPLTDIQEKSIQYMNSVFEQSDLQFRARLLPGQQVIFANKKMLHSRTEFTDRNPAKSNYDPSQLDNLESANRLMDRTWSYKR